MAYREIGTAVSSLLEVAKENAASYEAVQFPLEYNGRGFTWNGDAPFGLFSNDGLTYLAYRMTNWKDKSRWVDRKKLRSLYRSGNLQEFVRYANLSRRWQCTEDRSFESQALAAAFLPAREDGQPLRSALYGLMTEYNSYSNVDVINMIDDASLTSRVTTWEWRPLEMNVFLRTGHSEPIEWGLVIRNGETGHATLGYHMYISTKGTAFHYTTLPMASVRRHLSTLDTTVGNMKEALEEASSIEMDNTLTNSRVGEVKHLFVGTGWDSIRNILDMPDGTPLIKLVTALSAASDGYGSKTLALKALDRIFAFHLGE